VRNPFICLGLPDDGFSSPDSGGEHGPICIVGSQDDGQLLVIDPPFGPVDSGLGTCKPRVSQDYLIISQVSEEISEACLLGSSPGFNIGVIFEGSCFVEGPIDVEESSFLGEFPYGEV
jgi:hypothetical protein